MVRFLQCLHLIQQMRMRTDCPLAKDDQVAGDDIGALDRDPDGNGAVMRLQVVQRPVDHRLARMHVHRVVDAFAHPRCGVVFHDGRDHRQLVPLVQRRCGQPATRVDGIGIGRDPRHRLLHAAEQADGHVELLAHAGIGPRGMRRQCRACRRQRRQRNPAPGGQRAHQHHPAFARIVRPADDVVQRDEHVLAGGRPVHEHRTGWQVTATRFDARQIGRHKGAGDADVGRVPQQPIRVAQLERQPQHRAHRGQRDVTLGPVQADAQDLLALPLLLADHALVHHGRGVRTCVLAGQTECRQLFARGQTGQPVVALFLRTELQDQLSGAKRIGHHHGHRARHRPAGDIAHHFGVGVGGKTHAAVFLGNDHAKETVVAQIVPCLFRQVTVDAINLPVVQHIAKHPARPFDKGLFLCRQGRRLHLAQHCPVGLAGKQLCLEMHVAGRNRFGFGLGQGRQCGLGPFENRLGDVIATKWHDKVPPSRKRTDRPRSSPQRCAPRSQGPKPWTSKRAD